MPEGQIIVKSGQEEFIFNFKEIDKKTLKKHKIKTTEPKFVYTYDDILATKILGFIEYKNKNEKFIFKMAKEIAIRLNI